MPPTGPVRPREELLSKAPGAFAKLSFGSVHYRLLGAVETDSPLVVLLHGISGEGAVFLPLAECLLRAGYRVLLPDLYGRGFSDAANATQANNVALFTTMVAELLLHLSPVTEGASTRGIYLLGTSMGGAIAARFAELHPGLVRRLVLVCPAGLIKMPFISKLVKVPGLGELALSMTGRSSIAKNTAKAYADATISGAAEHCAHQVERALELSSLHPGSSDSLLSTVRHFELGGLSDTYDALGQRKEELPVLFVWGESDIVVPYELHEEARKRVPQASFLSLPACGHVDMYAVPSLQDTLQANVIAFFAGESVPVPVVAAAAAVAVEGEAGEAKGAAEDTSPATAGAAAQTDAVPKTVEGETNPTAVVDATATA